MNSKTKKLFEYLAKLDNQEDVSRIVNEHHSKIKLSLSSKGYSFSGGYEDLEGYQSISNKKDLLDSKYYEELNYIKWNLSDKWFEDLSDSERYKEIRNKIDDILDQFD